MVWSLLTVALLATSPKDLAEAKRLSHQAIVEYNSRAFAPALRDVTEAYRLSHVPGLLFNLAECHLALGHWKQAETFFRDYLREKKDAPNRAEVLLLIADMEARQRPAAKPAAAPPLVLIVDSPSAPPAPARPAPAAAVSGSAPRRRIKPVVWWVGGAGVVAGIAGTVLGVTAGNLAGQDHAFAQGGYLNHHLSASQYGAEQTDGLGADILWGAGVALVATAVILAVTSR